MLTVQVAQSSATPLPHRRGLLAGGRGVMGQSAERKGAEAGLMDRRPCAGASTPRVEYQVLTALNLRDSPSKTQW